MAKKKIKHYQTPQVVRNDDLDLNPRTKYQDLIWHPDFLSIQDYDAYTDRCKNDAIARKVVYKPAQDAIRNGWQIKFPKNLDLQAKIEQKMEELHVASVIGQQIGFQRKDGDGYLTVGVKEINPTDTATPIDPNNVQDVAFIHAFGQNNVKAYRTNDNPTSLDYGKESALVVQPHQAGYTVDKDGNLIPNINKAETVVIDKSRYCHISLDKFDDDETGTSIIKRCEKQLNVMRIALETTGKILREFTFKIVKSDTLMTEDDDKFARDRDQMSQSLNTEATAFIGSEDDIIKLSTQTNGINVLLDFAWQSLAAASNIPKSVLTGEQAGTLAGASQDVINYYDGIKVMQEQLIKPELIKIVRLLLYAKDVGGGIDPDSVDWTIEFNPLWTPDDNTQAETAYTKAQTASLWVSNGVYSPDEIRDQLNSQAKSNIQAIGNYTGDSAESRYTQDEIEQYKKDLEAAHGG